MKLIFIVMTLGFVILFILIPQKNISERVSIQTLKEGPVELTGIANIFGDPSDKVNCLGIVINGEHYPFEGDFLDFDKSVYGNTIRVTGMLEQRRSPMFIYDENAKLGGVPQGIPMPPGTDIEKEGLYYVIINPKWNLIK